MEPKSEFDAVGLPLPERSRLPCHPAFDDHMSKQGTSSNPDHFSITGFTAEYFTYRSDLDFTVDSDRLFLNGMKAEHSCIGGQLQPFSKERSQCRRTGLWQIDDWCPHQ